MADEPAPLAVGSSAPDFTLKDQNNEAVTLSSFRGRQAVLLVFYPFAFTGTCTGELRAIAGEPETFSSDRVVTLTVSCDTTYAHKIFSEREGFEFPLLSDFWPHGAVAQAYGVFRFDGGFANRGTFLIDVDGVVRFAEMNGPGQAREPQRWRDAIAALT
jgi:peroxiredoxin (alkyl hydroperoxide reductase subunit C)